MDHYVSLMLLVFVFPWIKCTETRLPLRIALVYSQRIIRSSHHSLTGSLEYALDSVLNQPEYANLSDYYYIEDKGNTSKMIVNLKLPYLENPSMLYGYLYEELLSKKVTTLILLHYGTISIPTTNFIIRIVNSLGIPVIGWILDYAVSSQMNTNTKVLQLLPSLSHQCNAMFDLLKHYDWTAITLVTGSMAGYDMFVKIIRDKVDNSYNFEILSTIHITSKNVSSIQTQLKLINETESRVILLYATRKEANAIFSAAKEQHLVGREFIWIVSSSVLEASKIYLPLGLLGVQVKVPEEIQERRRKSEPLKISVKLWAEGLKKMLENNLTAVPPLPKFHCGKSNSMKERDCFVADGQDLYKSMINVSLEGYTEGCRLEFYNDGTMKCASYNIVNLAPGVRTGIWNKIGLWTSQADLHIDKSIHWPGNASIPPKGRPNRYNLKVVTLKEQPYVVYSNPDKETGECPEQSLQCRVGKINGTSYANRTGDPNLFQCCSGYCIDLLQLLADDIGFRVELFEVEDELWGAPNDKGEWVGLVKSLIDHEADFAMTSLKITPERNQVVDFSLPFLETGITIIVAVRDGVVAPTAFLRPYDYPSWCLILIFSVHACGTAIFVFEWLSPSALDRGRKPISVYRFSLIRSFWLIWSMLFGAAVKVDNPRGTSSRFIGNIWALFAVVFTASYTANLATFMITTDDYDKLSGIYDPKLQQAHKNSPPYKFGTIPNGSTDVNIRTNFPRMSSYMYNNTFNYKDVSLGVEAVKDGSLDAFIYDATVLEYKARHDEKCSLKTVGTWHAMTGYGVAFPKGSKWLPKVNKVLRKLQYKGTLERLQKYWLAGTCNAETEGHSKSVPLGIINCTSAFMLLGIGIMLGVILLLLEHLYFKCCRERLRKIDTCGCGRLISLGLGKSLTFEETVQETIELQRHYKCKNPICEAHYHRLKNDLQVALDALKRVEHRYKYRFSHSKGTNRGYSFEQEKHPRGQYRVSTSTPQLQWNLINKKDNRMYTEYNNPFSRNKNQNKYSLVPSTSCSRLQEYDSPGFTSTNINTAVLDPQKYVIPRHRSSIESQEYRLSHPVTPPGAWQKHPISFEFPGHSRLKKGEITKQKGKYSSHDQVVKPQKISKSAPNSPSKQVFHRMKISKIPSNKSEPNILEIETVL